MKYPNLPLLLIPGIFIVLLSLSWSNDRRDGNFHSWEEMMAFQGGGEIQDNLPESSNSLFTGSGRCAGCHGYDINGIASVTGEGEDVNPTDFWRATMMANSAKDPFWRAKVSHEVAVNPDHQEVLEDKCTACHAPLGHFAAHYDGADFYSIAEMVEDSLALDGVSCGACHQIEEEGAGTTFSGVMEFQNDTLYGPYGGDPEEPMIFNQPMLSFVGYDPIYGEHILKSELCASCHTLITNTVDLEGEFTGNDFVEQATYHEWVNSSYSDPETGQECQECHFPKIDDPIVISSNYAFLEARTPYGLHHMVGGNSFMLELMKNNIDELGLWADEEDFDATIDRTITNLQQQSADVIIDLEEPEEDTITYHVDITNLTGHKFPSGYPARRAYVELLVTAENGDTIFHSGRLQDDFEVYGQNETYEPHYQVINSEEQVQIYEMVMADVNGDVTTVLERADAPLKDNRLVPAGFSTSHFAYDTTMMAGAVLTDLDFNDQGSEEGSGKDIITYRVGLDGYSGLVTASARLMYQSAPPKWNDELFSYDTPEIELFESMYWETGPSPVLVDEDEIELLVVGVDKLVNELEVYPNPTFDGDIRLSATKEGQWLLFTASGALLDELRILQGQQNITLPEQAGVYLLVNNESGEVHRIVRF